MERKRNIVESINAPQIHDLWIHNGELKYYGPSGWTPFGSSDENVKEELSSLSETIEGISTQVNNITSTIRDIIPKLDLEIPESYLNKKYTDGRFNKLKTCKGFLLEKENGRKIPYLAVNTINFPINEVLFAGFEGIYRERYLYTQLSFITYMKDGAEESLQDGYSINLEYDVASTTVSGLMSAIDKKNLDEVVSFNKEPANSPFIIGDNTNADILDTEVIMTLGQGDNKTNLWVVLIGCHETEDQTLQLEYNNRIISEKNYYYKSSSENPLSELLLCTVSLPANAAQRSCSIHVS